jgi:hypothetical protein
MSERHNVNGYRVQHIERCPNGDVLIEFTTPKGACLPVTIKSQHEKIIRPSEMMPTDEEEDVPPPDYGVRALQ